MSYDTNRTTKIGVVMTKGQLIKFINDQLFNLNMLPIQLPGLTTESTKEERDDLFIKIGAEKLDLIIVDHPEASNETI